MDLRGLIPLIARFFTGLFKPKNTIPGSEFGGRKVLFPIPAFDKEMIHYLKELAKSGKFKPVIDRQ